MHHESSVVHLKEVVQLSRGFKSALWCKRGKVGPQIWLWPLRSG